MTICSYVQGQLEQSDKCSSAHHLAWIIKKGGELLTIFKQIPDILIILTCNS